MSLRRVGARPRRRILAGAGFRSALTGAFARASAVLRQVRRKLRAAPDALYGIYVLLLLGAIGATTWITCALVPSTGWCWRFTHRMGRLFLCLAGIPLSVRGLEHVPSGRACVLAVNHASFLDGLVMAAALPAPTRFVAKRELLDHFATRIYLARIGTEFIERFDRKRGVEDTLRFISMVNAGHPLIFFPEGTFRHTPGLLPFRMGAFVIAALTSMPVVPVTLRGTRSVLREGQWLFRGGAISITFSGPIEPTGTGWNAAVALRDRARAEILRLCGEPDMSVETGFALKRAS